MGGIGWVFVCVGGGVGCVCGGGGGADSSF